MQRIPVFDLVQVMQQLLAVDLVDIHGAGPQTIHTITGRPCSLGGIGLLYREARG
jgi:hypothetical protein